MPSGICICSNVLPPTCVFTYLAKASPRKAPRFKIGSIQSVISASCMDSATRTNSTGVLPLAYKAATKLPAEVPATWLGLSPASSNT